MADTLQSVLIAGGAALASAALTYVSTRYKIRLDLAAKYDKQLQDARLGAYLKLWAMLEPLARYGRERPITHAVLSEVSGLTRSWYFRDGGIYITQASRGPYFRWKALMQVLLDDPKYSASPGTPISDTDLEPVVAASSTLRTSLSDDIGSKRLSLV